MIPSTSLILFSSALHSQTGKIFPRGWRRADLSHPPTLAAPSAAFTKRAQRPNLRTCSSFFRGGPISLKRARVKEHRLSENTMGLVCRLPRAQEANGPPCLLPTPGGGASTVGLLADRTRILTRTFPSTSQFSAPRPTSRPPPQASIRTPPAASALLGHSCLAAAPPRAR